MVSTNANDVATVTQPDQTPATGNEENEAVAAAEAIALPPAQTGPPPEAPAYAATYYTGQLPAAQGHVATTLNARATPGELRAQAQAFFDFLENPNNDLRDLNGEEGSIFTALVAVPDSHKVKVVYGLGIGTSGIGQISPIAGKLLALFGEGGGIMGPAQALLLDTSVTTKVNIKNITPAQIATVFQSGQHAEDQQVLRAGAVNTMHQIMKIAPIPAYFVWDGFNQDLEAAQVYERLMDSQEESTMKEHVQDFLRTCMIGNWRNNDEKPFTSAAKFYGMLPREARVWAAMRFNRLLPGDQLPALITPPRQGAQGTIGAQTTPQGTGTQDNGVFHLDTAALQQLFKNAAREGASAATITPDKEETTFKVSAGEKARMLRMCGLPDEAGDECFPKWFKDMFGKHMDEVTKAMSIATAVERNFVLDDAEVPLYPALTKTIMKRDWTGSDLGKRAALVNAAKGLSPFAMVDLTEEDVAEMTQDFEDLTNATAVSTADYKAARSRLAAKTPSDAEGFMLMLKRYANLLHALFSSQSPMYKQMYGIVRALRDYSPNARAKISHEVKSSILWIILLQSRRYAQGKMVGENACLGEFTNMVNLIKAKNCETITHVEVPTDLLSPTGKKRKEQSHQKDSATTNNDVTGGDAPKKKVKTAAIMAPYNAELKDFFEQPLKDAGYPGLNRICKFSGLEQNQLLPTLDKKTCRSYLIMGKCMWKHDCKFAHNTATKEEADTIIKKLQRFKDDPLGCKGEKKQAT